MKKKSMYVALLAALISFSMTMPSWLLVADNGVGYETGEIVDDGEYYTVLYNDISEKAAFSKMQYFQMIKSDDWGAVIKAPKNIATTLGNKFIINEIPERTKIQLLEQGIEFDSKTSYEIPQEWQVDSSSLYLVQFVAPFDAEWRRELEKHSTALFSMIGDNLAVVKLLPAEKDMVSSLPFIESIRIYQPYFKVYQNAREQTGTFRVKVSPVDASIERLSADLRGLGATDVLLNDGCNLVEVTITDAMLPEIARLETVGLVQYAPEMVQQGGLSSEMVGCYKAWNMNLSHLPARITGQGQVYQHDDLGLDETHYDFLMGPLGNRILFDQGGTDGNSHSTGCVGIAAGNGYDMEGYLGLNNMNNDYTEIAATNPIGFIDRAGFAGRAPEASIVFYDGLVTSEWDDGYTTYGSRIFSNSFGPAQVTNGYVNDADTFMASYPQGLVFFSACNYGPNEMTVTGTGNGKMVVSVGAAENNRPDWFDTSDNPYCLWTGSCKGPVSSTDMRVKPDVVEYGAGMLMPKSDDSSAADDDVYRGSNNDATWGIDYDPDARMDYYKNQGTSFSCPAAAGDAILIRDYLQDIVGMPAPDPMAIKAYLIEGARDMGYGYPSYGQGWGMCNVEYSICPPAPITNKYFTGTTTTTNWVNVNSSAVPLKVTMCHWDSDTSTGALTTDYDIVVTSPTGKRYEGNAFAQSRSIQINTPADWSGCAFPTWAARPSSYPTGAYDWDTANDGGDDINNVEVILIDSPEKGNWTIQVNAKSGSGPSWHVVAAADFGPVDAYDLDVKQDVPITWHVRNGYGTASFQAPAGQIVAVGFSVLNFGKNSDAITLSASYQGDGSTPGSPLPAGWSVAYDTGSTLNLQPNELKHVVARVTSPVSATEGAYPIRVTATSGGNSTIKDWYVFNIDIVNQRLPNRVKVTNDAYSLADMTPGVAAFNYLGTEYVVVAYVRDMGIGNRVFVSVSSDGGATFGAPIQVTTVADDPNYLELKCAPPGHDVAGRMFISYNGMNPLSNGMDWDDVTNRRAVVCYANPPYASWSVTIPCPNGQGTMANCDFRENDVGFWINPAGSDEVHFTYIEYQYASNSMGSNIDDMAPAEKVSTDGGATWPTSRIIHSDTGTYQFSLGCNNDYDGDLCASYYMISGTRVMFYQQYTGTWSTQVQAMNLNPYGAQWGYSGGDPTKERYYVVAGRASQSNYNDWKLPMVTYTDNDGGAWSTPAGPLGGSTNICDNGHFDGNNLMDVDVTGDAYAWVTARQVAQNTGNRYWSYNLYTASSNNGFTSWTNNYPTRDSFAKEPAFHSVAQGNNLLLAYNSVESGHSDVFLLKMYNGWATDATDNIGPITRFVHAPDMWQKDVPLSVVANIDDISTGYHTIQAAQYRWDGGTASAMNADDGSFNGVMESVNSLYSGSLTSGLHYLEVRGQDSIGNWGSWTGKWVNIYDFTPPTLPEEPVFAGLQSVNNPGSGSLLELAWNAAMDYQGQYPITYYIYRETFSGFDPNVTTPIGTWTPIANPGDPLTWDDTTVVEGTTYYYVVRAEDAIGTREYNFVEKSGTYESLLFFQVQSPETGYRNLNMDPMELTIQTSTTDVITSTGNWQVDTTSGKWRSDQFASATDLSGIWRFYVYGQMNNNHANGFLYAVVKKYSDNSILFTTGLDDEDVASYVGAYHKFEWQYTASGVSIGAGDRYYVELWLNVTTVTSTPGGREDVFFETWPNYDAGWQGPADTPEDEAGWVVGYYALDPADTAVDNTATGTPPSSPNFGNLNDCDNGATTPPFGSYDWFWTGHIDLSTYTSCIFSYYWQQNGFDATGDTAAVYYSTTVTSSNIGTSTDWTLMFSYDGSSVEDTWFYAEYNIPDVAAVSTFSIIFTCRCDMGGEDFFFDDIKVSGLAGTGIPDGQFTFAYDYSATPSSLHQPGGAATPTFNVPVIAGWNLISYPLLASGAPQTVLNDAAGDGLTLWNMMQWYSIYDAADHWKAYASFMPASLNDLLTVNNTMGFWVYVTQVGDGYLTIQASQPTNTNIYLKAGWNLVGYPSNTPRVASTTLPASADIVGIFNATDPYRTTDKNPSDVTMQAGKGYWVHCTADAPWTVPW